MAWENEREEGKGGRKERAEGEMNREFDGKEWEWIGRVGCGERKGKGEVRLGWVEGCVIMRLGKEGMVELRGMDDLEWD